MTVPRAGAENLRADLTVAARKPVFDNLGSAIFVFGPWIGKAPACSAITCGTQHLLWRTALQRYPADAGLNPPLGHPRPGEAFFVPGLPIDFLQAPRKIQQGL